MPEPEIPTTTENTDLIESGDVKTIHSYGWRSILRRIGQIALMVGVVMVLAYVSGIIYYHGIFAQAGVGNLLLVIFWLGAVVVVFLKIKPWKLRATWWGVGLAIVVVPYLSIRPSNDKNWEPEFARTGYAKVDGNVVTLYNVRNFKHHAHENFDERWESRTYHLSNLREVDYIQSNFYGDTLAHPILSFDFGPEGRICLSVETRREVGEAFTPFGGLYKMFELQYLFITEEDCIPLRTDVRREVVRRYTIKGTPEKIRETFLASLRVQNELADNPRFYNVIHANCTTSLRALQSESDRVPWDMRLLFNGMLDEYLYEKEFIETHGLPFDQLRKKMVVR